MSTPLRIVALAGSLRRASLNRGVARAAVELAPPGTVVEAAYIDDIPLYNGDLDGATQPPGVAALKAKLAAADAVLIVTPEYNYSVPGVLKNTLDWLSRGTQKPLKGKPVAIVGASPGYFGTVRSQTHLRWVLDVLQARNMPQPEMIVPLADKKADADGNLTDEETRNKLRGLLERLVEWAARFPKED
ncbi:MAG: NAD(P)H-dependent oxidoreductase [Candidatus Eisenbacteria bacterium]|uniref:NAD(P)H-dependent oxidoreductase n=1 Tax=Eiseniibacteriota bacterium TaxID=2212470 RepID=A0A849SNK9_UNCEI|nr:NAD(P)H-dependent oxidoreductase [Candidatus Eisenbacteria bacterium]